MARAYVQLDAARGHADLFIVAQIINLPCRAVSPNCIRLTVRFAATDRGHPARSRAGIRMPLKFFSSPFAFGTCCGLEGRGPPNRRGPRRFVQILIERGKAATDRGHSVRSRAGARRRVNSSAVRSLSERAAAWKAAVRNIRAARDDLG